jgi:hypothetical protein
MTSIPRFYLQSIGAQVKSDHVGRLIVDVCLQKAFELDGALTMHRVKKMS